VAEEKRKGREVNEVRWYGKRDWKIEKWEKSLFLQSYQRIWPGRGEATVYLVGWDFNWLNLCVRPKRSLWGKRFSKFLEIFTDQGISLISHHLSLGMLRLAIKKTGDFEYLFTGIEVRYYAHSTEVGFTQQAFPLRFLIGWSAWRRLTIAHNSRENADFAFIMLSRPIKRSSTTLGFRVSFVTNRMIWFNILIVEDSFVLLWTCWQAFVHFLQFIVAADVPANGSVPCFLSQTGLSFSGSIPVRQRVRLCCLPSAALVEIQHSNSTHGRPIVKWFISLHWKLRLCLWSDPHHCGLWTLSVNVHDHKRLLTGYLLFCWGLCANQTEFLKVNKNILPLGFGDCRDVLGGLCLDRLISVWLNMDHQIVLKSLIELASNFGNRPFVNSTLTTVRTSTINWSSAIFWNHCSPFATRIHCRCSYNVAISDWVW